MLSDSGMDVEVVVLWCVALLWQLIRLRTAKRIRMILLNSYVRRIKERH